MRSGGIPWTRSAARRVLTGGVRSLPPLCPRVGHAAQDVRLAEFVVDSHIRSHPDFEPEDEPEYSLQTVNEAPIDQKLLRKYIMYARTNVRPQLQSIDEEKIKNVYAELRRESERGGVAIAVRHIESIIRMAEASARMHLRSTVRADAVDLAP